MADIQRLPNSVMQATRNKVFCPRRIFTLQTGRIRRGLGYEKYLIAKIDPAVTIQ